MLLSFQLKSLSFLRLFVYIRAVQTHLKKSKFLKFFFKT